MAVMGLRLAARANGVAKLHGEVAREMFGGMWPDLPSNETPIGHITNGVHARTWVSDRTDELLTGALGDDWHLAGADAWARVRNIDQADIWAMRNVGRQELVDLVRDRLGHDLLDPNVLTIGFARRFATYKRANLLLDQIDRLRALLLDADRPVQFVFAGKAHPADHPGKGLIQQIAKLAADADVRHRFVFIPDYDIGIARTMYHGCDVWLNTPRRPFEACGTSGEKATLNGVLNCSILDGWWAEMSDGSNGFDIPSFDDDHDLARRDHREASATFDVIEQQIVPLFYDRTRDAIPSGWIELIQNNWETLGWNVVAARMVRDYVTTLYEPAAASSDLRLADGAAAARELSAWKVGVASAWPSVSIELLDDGSDVGRRRQRRRPVRFVSVSTPASYAPTNWSPRSCTAHSPAMAPSTSTAPWLSTSSTSVTASTQATSHQAMPAPGASAHEHCRPTAPSARSSIPASSPTVDAPFGASTKPIDSDLETRCLASLPRCNR